MQPWAIRVGPKPLGPNLPLLLSPFTPHFSSSYSHAPHLSATHFLQPPTSSSTLHLRVQGTCSLSPSHRHSLLNQVTRMLRLSESEENKLREFRSIVEALHGDEELATECLRSFGGRVFRSPTLFEDMVKCILLCNCQFSRTLSMAKALFELQFEIEHQIPGVKAEDYFIPKTPTGKELKRKLRPSQEIEAPCDYKGMGLGSFPSPEELANLDESFLAKRCNFGYRAGRILKLAQGIVQGSIQLKQLEEDCKETNLSSYNKLAERLRQIDGYILVLFEPFGVSPSDTHIESEQLQVHSKSCSIKTVGRDFELIYAKYAPFQFLAYW
ncbi:Leucine-rich repeat (LRR) family protein [Hibiscus syriacus]|uniref:Leucine-rich repeat (LRR) family protein n=1 Tax=Hibiscus syriacus TaxID=106335 RepID=A0A6A3A622_HIBSY|nr:Leucine-rich repeat (LRR) family protein [Hibiscus syriacus]